jgi:hypothetical protein
MKKILTGHKDSKKTLLPGFLIKIPRRLFFYSLLVIVLFVIIFYPYILILEIVPSLNNKAFLSIPVKKGDTFTIRFTHSVQKTPVDETFSIGRNLKMVLEETVYSSYGAGLPSEVNDNQEFLFENGKFIIRKFDMQFDEIPLFVGEVIANHTIIYNDKKFPLVSYKMAGKSVRIRLCNYSLISYIRILLSQKLMEENNGAKI